MAHFERDILDQSQVVELKRGDGSGPTVAMTPADAPSVMLGDGRDYGGLESDRRFTWRPTMIVIALVLIAFLAAAFL